VRKVQRLTLAAANQAIPTMPWRRLQVDAFTDAPFTGNPAAVCLVPTRDHGIPDELSHAMGALSEATMKGIALEMNLSETAFLTTRPPGQNFATATDFHLRWFTPKVEVPLCGHVRAPDLGRSAGTGKIRQLTSLPNALQLGWSMPGHTGHGGGAL